MPATPLPITADVVAEIVLKGTMSAGGSNVTPSGNVFYYRRSAVGAALNKANISAQFAATVVTPWLAAANAAWAPNSTQIRFIDNAQDLAATTAVAGAGAIATDSEPSVDAVVCMLTTAFRGRNARGFKHLGGSNEVDTLRDVLVGAGLGRWQAVRDALKAQFVDADGNTWKPFVFSRLGSQIRTNPTVVRGADVTNSFLNLTIGSMRKRKAVTVR